MADISNLIKRRNRTLALAAVTFLVWQGAWLVQDFPGVAAGDAAAGVISVIMAIGALGWAISMALFLVYAGKLGQAGAQAIVEDELFHHHKRLAMIWGWAAMIAVVSLFQALDSLAVGFAAIPQVSAGLVLRSLLIVGVLTPLIVFLLHARDGAEGEA
ncbi:hypothetical protein [Maricaulis sp. CAU 1757]